METKWKRNQNSSKRKPNGKRKKMRCFFFALLCSAVKREFIHKAKTKTITWPKSVMAEICITLLFHVFYFITRVIYLVYFSNR